MMSRPAMQISDKKGQNAPAKYHFLYIMHSNHQISPRSRMQLACRKLQRQ